MREKKDQETRRTCVTLMVTPAERKRLRAAADKLAMPLSVYLRTIALSSLKTGSTLTVTQAKA